MSDGQDIDRFVKDPSLLVELCREVIDELDASNDGSDIGEREAQLREIAKTIERLEKAGVSVPDVLRGEKTRLAASLAVHADSTQALGLLADEFANIVKELKTRLGQGQTVTTAKTKGKRARAPKTDKNVLTSFAPCGNLAAVLGWPMSSRRWDGNWRASCCPAIWNGARQPMNTSGRTIPSGSAIA